MYAIDLLNQFNDYNGTVLSNGKMYVYYLGRVALANVYHDVDGQVPIPNPIELDNLGMAQVYVSNAHDYTIVLTDAYGNEMFSRDLFVNGSAEGGGNARLYEGIDPIVVNNEQNIISAKLANLGVESPLYFIEDTEESTVIGVSGDFASVSASANLTAYKEDDVTWISGKDWSTDITNASANAYEQATANDYRPLFEGNNGKISAIDNSAILIPDVVDYSAGANINISNHVVSLDTAVELTDILRDRGAILDPSGLYVSNLQQTTYTEIGKDHVFSTDGSASIGWQLSNKAISIGDNSGNGDYRNLILGLDDVLLEERHQEPTPDKVYSLTGACESALSAINMINSGDNQAYSAGANINITDHVISGKDWSTEIGDKLDTTAFSDVSGNFLTAHQSLDGLMSADLLEFSGAVITAYSGCKFVGEISGDAGDAEVNALVHSNSGTWDSVTSKLDESAFSDVSGSFITAIPDLYVYKSATECTIGDSNTAQYTSFAQGYGNSARECSVAIGFRNNAEYNSVAMGDYNTALYNSISVGGYCSAGDQAQAFGRGVTSQSGMAIGNANLTTSAAFVIGNGHWDFGENSDLFRIDPDGKAYIQKETEGSSAWIIPVRQGYYDSFWTGYVYSGSNNYTFEFGQNTAGQTSTGKVQIILTTSIPFGTSAITSYLNEDATLDVNFPITGTPFSARMLASTNVKIADPISAQVPAIIKSMVRMATLDDIPTGSVPQSAFDELKQSYDALSSLFSTYSGQWLLPITGV